jgi:hypothetical protein
MSKQPNSEQEQEHENESEQETSTENDVEDSEEGGDNDDERIPIDLSKNEIYRGICTLFEDEDGNNILEYISLLHTELIGINKSLENLKSIKKDMSRIADCAETLIKVSTSISGSASAPVVSSTKTEKDKKTRKEK